MTDLGPSGGGSAASGVSGVGQVVGFASTAGASTYDAAVWTRSGGTYGTATDLGAAPGDHDGMARAVNSSGVIVGWASTNTLQHALVWTPGGGLYGAPTVLRSLGGIYSAAMAINKAGAVAGYSYNAANVERAVVWQRKGSGYGPPIDFGLLAGSPSGGASYASGINDGGQVVGESDTATNAHAVVWSRSAGAYGAPVDLGTLGGTFSMANAINAGGQIVGSASTPGNAAAHAVLWNPADGGHTSAVDLGTLGGILSTALAVNNSGLIVGDSYLSGQSGPDPATLWVPSNGVYGSPTTLGTLGGTSARAAGINDVGQIVGRSYVSGDAAQHAFVISPVTSTTSTLHSSRNPSEVGLSVTFIDTLSSKLASGTVQFWDGTTTLGTPQPVTSGTGKATFSTSALGAGNHSITATYSGDDNFTPSTSPAITEKVKTATTTALISSANPAAIGQPVTFTAALSDGAATGRVTFRDGSTVLARVIVSAGDATFTTSSLSAGSHNITATYGGDTAFAPSTSSTEAEQVG